MLRRRRWAQLAVLCWASRGAEGCSPGVPGSHLGALPRIHPQNAALLPGSNTCIVAASPGLTQPHQSILAAEVLMGTAAVEVKNSEKMDVGTFAS